MILLEFWSPGWRKWKTKQYNWRFLWIFHLILFLSFRLSWYGLRLMMRLLWWCLFPFGLNIKWEKELGWSAGRGEISLKWGEEMSIYTCCYYSFPNSHNSKGFFHIHCIEVEKRTIEIVWLFRTGCRMKGIERSVIR